MSLPSDKAIAAARRVSGDLADRNTAFVFNEWYVAAFTDEIGRDLKKRTLLGRELVFFRTEAGQVVAFDDRCIHRSFPLSMGTLDHDTVVCGYHGIRYDHEGNIIEVPSQTRCPVGLGVRSYAVHETGPLVWIWMGEKAAADSATIPALPWMTNQQWALSRGYFDLRSNYVSLHENLLDLTHLSYLHAKSFGTPDYVSAPYEIDLREGYYALLRRVVPTTLPPVWGETTRVQGSEAARITRSEFLSPAMHLVSATFYDTKLSEGAREEFQIRTAHIPTPQTHGSTHYFIVHGRDYRLDEPAVTQFMHDQLFVAFNEDVTGLEALEKILEAPRDDFFEVSVASDRPSMEMRRYLRRRADAEAAALRERSEPGREQSISPPKPLAA